MSLNADETEEAHVPSWLVEENDQKHVQETVAPLFGSGTLNLLDATDPSQGKPKQIASQQQQQQEKASSYGSTGVTSQQQNKTGGGKKRTTEQAAQEIQSLAKAYGKMQQQKQQAEENRRLFSQQQKKNGGGGGGGDWNNSDNDGLDSEDNNSGASPGNKKKNKTTKKTDEFGTIIDSSKSVDEGDGDNEDEEDEMNDEEKQALLLKEQLKPHMPKQNACLWFFHLLAGFSVVVLLCLVATQIIPVVAVKRAAHNTGQWWQQIGIFSLALKVYISFFSLAFCMVEMHLNMPFLRSANLLQNFVSRGFIYSFVGLVATSEAYQEHVQNAMNSSSSGSGSKQSSSSTIAAAADSLAKEVPWEAIFMQVSAWVMLGIGFFYTLMGICCLQPLFERLREQERHNWQKYRTDYRAWKAIYGKK